MKFEYPHTIENGHGESLTFVARRTDERGEYLEVTNVVQPGSGPPMHVHHRQDESLTVVKGRIGYQILGEEPKFAGPGETVTFEKGSPHKFWADGEEVLECTGWVRPPDNIEYFLGEIYRSTRENGGKPDDFEAAYLMHRYRNEFDMVDIPGFVKVVIFPVLRTVGGMTGKYKRFEDAPPPAG